MLSRCAPYRKNGRESGVMRTLKHKLKKMKRITEKIEVYDPESGALVASCYVDVFLSWYLYPIILVKEKRYLAIPGLLGHQGHAQLYLPHEQQINWWKCLCSWKRYKRKYVIPFVANMEYRVLEGVFVGGVSSYDLA